MIKRILQKMKKRKRQRLKDRQWARIFSMTRMDQLEPGSLRAAIKSVRGRELPE